MLVNPSEDDNFDIKTTCVIDESTTLSIFINYLIGINVS